MRSPPVELPFSHISTLVVVNVCPWGFLITKLQPGSTSTVSLLMFIKLGVAVLLPLAAVNTVETGGHGIAFEVSSVEASIEAQAPSISIGANRIVR